MSEHENGNFVLKCGQNQQKYQSFMAISDFALLYRIRRSCARYQLLSSRFLLCLYFSLLVSAGTGTIYKISHGLFLVKFEVDSDQTCFLH